MDRLNARKRVIGNRRRGAGRISRGTRPRRLALESLEDRTLLAVYTPTLFTDGVTGGTATLRDCIIKADANPGSTICLKAGVYTLSISNTAGQENASCKGDLDITAPMTIQGNGAIIDQTAADRVFQILAPNSSTLVTFDNLTIEGGQAVDNGASGAPAGKSQADGGGILTGGAAGCGANLVLCGVTFYNDVARAGTSQIAAGGGLYSSGSTSNCVTLNNVIFLANSALGGCGAAGTSGSPNGCAGGAAYGGAMFVCGDQVTLGGTSDTFTTNSAVGGSGGAGFSCSTAGCGGLGGCAAGGAIDLTGDSLATASCNPLVIFTANRATGGAGGSGGNGCTAGRGGMGGTAQGGAIADSCGTSLILANTDVTSNIATGGSGGRGGNGTGAKGNGACGGAGGCAQGGGLYLYSVSSACLSLPYLNSNLAWGGSGGAGGNGSICYTAPGGCAGAGGCAGNAQGGGLFTAASTVTVNCAYVLSNIALGGNGGSTGVPGVGTTVGAYGAGGAAGSAQGGGAFLYSGTLTLFNVLVSGNLAEAGAVGIGVPLGAAGTAAGGGVFNYGGTLYEYGTTSLVGNYPGP